MRKVSRKRSRKRLRCYVDKSLLRSKPPVESIIQTIAYRLRRKTGDNIRNLTRVVLEAIQTVVKSKI